MTDVDERYRMELSNGALIHFPTTKTVHADLTVSLSRPQLLRLLSTGSLDGVAVDGDPGILKTLLSLTDQPDPSFNVVTP
jgi:alkyl sulfatase BDS1-like metallo-beta-lactamase superfamily hydrolase